MSLNSLYKYLHIFIYFVWVCVYMWVCFCAFMCMSVCVGGVARKLGCWGYDHEFWVQLWDSVAFYSTLSQSTQLKNEPLVQLLVLHAVTLLQFCWIKSCRSESVFVSVCINPLKQLSKGWRLSLFIFICYVKFWTFYFVSEIFSCDKNEISILTHVEPHFSSGWVDHVQVYSNFCYPILLFFQTTLPKVSFFLKNVV